MTRPATTPKQPKHRWRESRYVPGFVCSSCRRHVHVKDDSACLIAVHPDPEINALYRDRRRAAEAADSDSGAAARGWSDLESIQARLRAVDPDGDWYYEGNRHDGQGWQVRRPSAVASPLAAGLASGAGIVPSPSIHNPEGGDRMSSTTPEVAPAKPKAQSAPKVADGITVEALVAALAEAGVKATVKWNPKRTYARLLVAKKNIGYVDAPNRNGMKVTPAVALADLKNGTKRAFSEAKGSGQYAAVLVVTDEKGLGHAVAALVAADEKRQAAKEAK